MYGYRDDACPTGKLTWSQVPGRRTLEERRAVEEREEVKAKGKTKARGRKPKWKPNK